MAAKKAKKSGFSIWKLLRWLVLAALVVVILLMIQKPAPLSGNTASAQELAEAAKSFDAKLMELEQAHANGTSSTTIEITEVELNGLIQRSSGQAPWIAMAGDEITGQFIAQPYGKDVYVTISARLSADNGHLVVHPARFKIGVMPIPATLADRFVQKKLADPEMQDKMKLPDFIKNVRVENGKLVIGS